MTLYTNIKGPINYTTVGSPTIVDGVASGFSESNYLTLQSSVNSDDYDVIEFNTKITTGNSIADGLIIGIASYYVVGLAIINSKLTCRTNFGSYVNAISDIILQANTTYTIKGIIDKRNSTISINVNGTINSASFSYETARGLSYRIGQSNAIGSFNGSIDLNETYININGNAWFGTSFSRVKLHSPTAIAYTKVGNPTITSDGVASGFTDKTDYLTLGAFNPGTSKWKFTTKVKIYDYATQISLIDRNSSKRCFQIVVRTTGKFRVNISTNGSSKANEVDGTHVVSVNTIYYICFEYDGSKYYLKYSLDNINWVTDITINNSTKIYPVSSMCMGHSWYNSGTEKWNGEIYLRYTRFEINGVTNDKYKLHCLEGS